MRSSHRFSKKAGDKWRGGFAVEFVRSALVFLVGFYRSVGAVHFGGACRFEPSCSVYAVEALNTHTPMTAIRLIAARLLKCRPGGPWGYDPVPGVESRSESRGESK